MILLLLALTACERQPEESSGSAAGEYYALAAVGSDTLPAVLSQDSVGRLELAAGDVTLMPDSTFSMRLVTRTVIQGVEAPDTGRQSGSYVLTPESITFNYSSGATETGSVEGDRIVLNSSGFVLTFQR